MVITAERARAIVSAALEIAERGGHQISTAVLDADGTLVAFGRSDGSRPYTAELAQSKAYCWILTERTSAEVAAIAEARPQFFSVLKDLGLRTLAPSPGGIPIPGGGAIGISGADRPEDDVAIAEAALLALEQTGALGGHG